MGRGRVAQREGAEYVGDLGTFNGARLAATGRKGIRYFPLFTAFHFLSSSFFSSSFLLFSLSLTLSKRQPRIRENDGIDDPRIVTSCHPVFLFLPIFQGRGGRFKNSRKSFPSMLAAAINNATGKRRLRDAGEIYLLLFFGIWQRSNEIHEVERRGTKKDPFIIQPATN